MQLGARWEAGHPPHRGVPEQLHAAIAAQEAVHPDARSWTLTWLEGRPRCLLDEVVVVSLDANGVVSAVAAGPHLPGAGADSHDDDDDDDDWLS